MKHLAKLTVLAVLILLAAGPAPADNGVTLEGSFVWTRDDGESTGDLTAVLTPGDENDWDVAFHFVWEDEAHTYLGTANGSLDAGSLSGTAESDNEDNKTTFRFKGEFENGEFNGTHGWVNKEGELEEAGHLTLARRRATTGD